MHMADWIEVGRLQNMGTKTPSTACTIIIISGAKIRLVHNEKKSCWSCAPSISGSAWGLIGDRLNRFAHLHHCHRKEWSSYELLEVYNRSRHSSSGWHMWFIIELWFLPCQRLQFIGWHTRAKDSAWLVIIYFDWSCFNSTWLSWC